MDDFRTLSYQSALNHLLQEELEDFKKEHEKLFGCTREELQNEIRETIKEWNL